MLNSETRDDLRRRVLRGVRVLDEKDPGWWNGGTKNAVLDGMVGHIDLDDLDMFNADRCILGQRYVPEADYFHDVNRYAQGLRALGLRVSGDAGFTHGFDLSFSERSAEDARARRSYLTELWVTVIQSRRRRFSFAAFTSFARQANKTWQPRVA